MRAWERKLAITIACAATIIAVGTCTVEKARANPPVSVYLQSPTPWTLAQCDRIAGARAIAVANISTWNRGGWPLWRVVCVYDTRVKRVSTGEGGARKLTQTITK